MKLIEAFIANPVKGLGRRPGDGVCATLGGNCTLSAAITEANLDSRVFSAPVERG